MTNLGLMWDVMGPGIAGAVFGAGWWFWVDAVVCSAVKVSFIHYLPGIFASLATLMFNCVDRKDIVYDYYSSYGESEWRCWRQFRRLYRHRWACLYKIQLRGPRFGPELLVFCSASLF